MPILTDNKFSAEDFQSFEFINKWWNSDKKNIFGNKSFKDSEGYTPLGGAILNGASNECLAYVMALYTYNYNSKNIARETSYNENNPWRDITSDKSKGKSPLEIACMCMNVSAVEVLLKSSYEYLDTDDEGNYIHKLDNYGTPLIEDYELIPEGEEAYRYFLYTSVPFPYSYTGIYSKTYKLDLYKSYLYDKLSMPDHGSYKSLSKTDIKERDILAASNLKKSDILNILLHYYINNPTAYCSCTHTSDNLCNTKKDLHTENIRDPLNNTPLLLAVNTGCYESVYLLLNHDCSPISAIRAENSDNYDSLDVAVLSDDQDLIDILHDYFITYTLHVTELHKGKQSSCLIQLKEKPDNDVTVSVSSTDTTRLIVLTPSLTFTKNTYNIDKAITFKAIDDKKDSNNITVSITLSFSSDDKNYDGLVVTLPSITIIDND